ncbi:hypothetical protein EMIHUDRAFT_357302, partial [Emiliania huxleyi CCMP1516]|uniref:Syntaxin N-terminal domain-containing protein n=2 Tax=Emiliania huxleyi TaxID=2903 RepID=A0A0D3IN39_EMIH1
MVDRLDELKGGCSTSDIEMGAPSRQQAGGASGFMAVFFQEVNEVKAAMCTIRANIARIEAHHGEALGAISAEQGKAATVGARQRPLQPAGDLHADHPAGPRTRAGAQRAGRHPRQASRHPQAGGVDRRAAPALPRHVGASGDAGRDVAPLPPPPPPRPPAAGPCRRRAPLRCKVPEARAPKVLLRHRHATDRRRHPAGNHHTKLLM